MNQKKEAKNEYATLGVEVRKRTNLERVVHCAAKYNKSISLCRVFAVRVVEVRFRRKKLRTYHSQRFH